MHVHISVGESMERKRVKNVVRTRVRYTLVFEYERLKKIFDMAFSCVDTRCCTSYVQILSNVYI